MSLWKFACRRWWSETASLLETSHSETVSALRCRALTSDGLDTSVREETLEILRQPTWSIADATTLLFFGNFLRKWRIADSSTSLMRKEKAYDGFILRNQAAAQVDRLPYPYGYWVRRILAAWLPDRSDVVYQTGRFGPGACAERMTHDERISALGMWLSNSATWPENPSGLCTAGSTLASHECARLCAVPKAFDKDRLITVEPAYGTFSQQCVRSAILESIHSGPLRGSVFDQAYVDSPAVQRKLALRASKSKAQATVDLSDASDHITWSVVRDVFPAWVVRLLEVTRSSSFVDPRTKIVRPLSIFAGMGNATTFVIETLFFAATVKALALAHGLRDRRVSVFGDDIICSSDVVPILSRVEPFLVVNATKTFSGADALRESCGIYAYEGMDVTVPDIRGYPHTYEGSLGVADLYRRIRRQFHQFDEIANRIRDENSLPVFPCDVENYPCIADGNAVWRDGTYQQRINKDLQHLELRLPVWEPKFSVKRAKGYLARGLYALSLAGATQAVYRRCRGSDSAIAHIKIPTGRRSRRWRWLQATPIDWETV